MINGRKCEVYFGDDDADSTLYMLMRLTESYLNMTDLEMAFIIIMAFIYLYKLLQYILLTVFLTFLGVHDNMSFSSSVQTTNTVDVLFSRVLIFAFS